MGDTVRKTRKAPVTGRQHQKDVVENGYARELALRWVVGECDTATKRGVVAEKFFKTVTKTKDPWNQGVYVKAFRLLPKGWR